MQIWRKKKMMKENHFRQNQKAFSPSNSLSLSLSLFLSFSLSLNITDLLTLAMELFR